MPIAVQQASAFGEDSNFVTSTSTIAATLATSVTVHSTLVAWVSHDSGSSTPSISVSDNVNGPWPAAALIDNFAADGSRLAVFAIPNAAAGSTTATATFGSNVTAKFIVLCEVSGAATSSVVDGTPSARQQVAPGTGTDAVTTNASTSSLQPALLLAFGLDLGPGVSTPAVGTSFTDGGTFIRFGVSLSQPLARLESRRVTATGAQTATFTAVGGAGGHDFQSMVIVLDEAGIAPAVVPPPPSPITPFKMIGPGRFGPGPKLRQDTWQATLNRPLTGVEGDTAVGTVVPSITVPITGVSATTAIGSLGANITVPLTNVVATGAVGTVTASGAGSDLTLAITGVAGSGSVGSMGVNFVIPATGNAATGSVGSMLSGSSVPTTGVAATGAVGTLVPSSTVALTGVAGTGSVGTLSHAATARLTCSSDGRYFLNGGSPFFLKGDSAWGYNAQLTPANQAIYLNDRQNRKFNTVLMEFMSHQTASPPYGAANSDGDLPFLHNSAGGSYTGTGQVADFSTPNDTYWAKVAIAMNLAVARGFIIVGFPMVWGFAGGSARGWYQDIINAVNTTAVHQGFAAYLANGSGGSFGGLASNVNLLLMVGSDYGSNNSTPPSATALSRQLAFMQALKSNGFAVPMSFDGQAPSGGTTETTFTPECTSNALYTYGGTDPTTTASEDPVRTYTEARKIYQFAPTVTTQSTSGSSVPSALPTFLIETAYAHSTVVSPGDDPQVRKAMNWAWLSGATAGMIWGNESIYSFQDTQWQGALADSSTSDMTRLWNFVDGFAWWKLVPSEQSGISSRLLIVSANGTQSGTPTTYVASAMATDGTLLVAYMPPSGSSSQSCDVDLRGMAGSMRARWWDPTNGNFTAIGSGIANTSASTTFTIPGNNSAATTDWFLVLDVAPQVGGKSLDAINVIGPGRFRGGPQPGRNLNFASQPQVTAALTGVAATGTVGAMGPGLSVPITGNAGTGSVGSVAVASSLGLTGVSAVGSAGTPASDFTVPITGVAAAGSVGTVGPSSPGSAGLSGTSAVGQTGSVSPGISVALTGVSGTTAVGSMGPAITSPITGVSATGHVGDVTETGGDTAGTDTSGFASTMLAQFDANMLLVEANPTTRRFKPANYRMTLDREPDTAVGERYYLDLESSEPIAMWFGSGRNVSRGVVNVQLGFHRGGGSKGGHRGESRRIVLGSAANDCIKVRDVCSNPENYNAQVSGIRVVTPIGFLRLFDLPHLEVWQVSFRVEWEHETFTS